MTTNNNQNKPFLQLEGYADDLLAVDEKYGMKHTRLLDLGQNDEDEVIDVTIMSTNPATDEHPKFDKLLGKKIRITVEVIAED